MTQGSGIASWILWKLHHEAGRGNDGIPALVGSACPISQPLTSVNPAVAVGQTVLGHQRQNAPPASKPYNVDVRLPSLSVYLSLSTAHYSPSSSEYYNERCQPISSSCFIIDGDDFSFIEHMDVLTALADSAPRRVLPNPDGCRRRSSWPSHVYDSS